MILSRLYFTILCFLCLTPSYGAGDVYDHDYRLWSSFTWDVFQKDKVKGTFHNEIRWFENISRVGAYVIQPKIHYQLGEGTVIGLGPSFINLEKEKAPDNNKIRAEFQVVQKLWQAQEHSVSMRHRLELRWWQANDRETEPMTRQRFSYFRKSNVLPQLVKIGVSNEFFYDWYRSDFNENRFYPINLVFKGRESKVITTIFFQVRSRKRLEQWQEAYVFGFDVRF